MNRLIVVALILATLIVFLIIFMMEQKITNTSNISENESTTTTTTITTTTTTTLPTQASTNQTENETNITPGAPGANPPSTQNQNVSTKPKAPPEISNLCLSKPSAAVSNQTPIITSSKGMVYCLNQKYPYYLIMELNDSNLTTWISGKPETEESFNISVENTIYYLFVGDLSDIDIESFYMVSNVTDYFFIGDYFTYTTQKDENEKELIAVLPFNVNNETINSTEDWEEIKFYLKSSLKDFYLGNLFVKIN